MKRLPLTVSLAMVMVIASACAARRGVGVAGDGASGRPDTWTVQSEPSVTIKIGDNLREPVAGTPTSAVVLTDGTIVVAIRGTSHLRFYDANGQIIRDAGASGDDPAGLTDLHAVWQMRGDTVLAWESGPRRLSYFTPTGEFIDVRSVVIPPIPISNGRTLANSASPRGVFRDGSLFVLPNLLAIRANDRLRPDAVRGDYFRMERPVFVLPRDPAGALIDSSPLPPLDVSAADTLGVFSSNEFFAYPVNFRGVRHGRYASVIFGERFMVAQGPDVVAIGYGKPYVVTLYDQTGAVHGSISRLVAPVPATEEMVHAYKNRFIANASEEDRALRAATWEPVPAADTLPAYTGLQFDRAGNLWVREFAPEADDGVTENYSIFSPDGRWLAQLREPSALWVLDRGPDYLLTRSGDESDIEQIQLYRIRR